MTMPLAGSVAFRRGRDARPDARETEQDLYVLFKGEDPDFVAFSDFVRPATYEWDTPKIDSVMMHHVREYARGRGKVG